MGVASDIIQMFCHIVDDVGCYGRVILLPLFVVLYGTFLNYDEDVNILVEYCFMFIYLITIDWVFIIFFYSSC